MSTPDMTMNMNMNLDITTILSIGSAALGCLGLVGALFAMRATRGLKAHCVALETSLASMRRELESAVSISVRMGRRVKRIEQEYAGVAERVDRVELKGSAHSFDRAIDYARRGADSGKLTQQFGLSRGEADLVTLLHGRKKSA